MARTVPVWRQAFKKARLQDHLLLRGVLRAAAAAHGFHGADATTRKAKIPVAQ
jgi:hypothetical protein